MREIHPNGSSLPPSSHSIHWNLSALLLISEPDSCNSALITSHKMTWHCSVLSEMNKNNSSTIEWRHACRSNALNPPPPFIVRGSKCRTVPSDSHWGYGLGASHIGDNCCHDFHERDTIWPGVMSVYQTPGLQTGQLRHDTIVLHWSLIFLVNWKQFKFM